jgi:hypothetical protein
MKIGGKAEGFVLRVAPGATAALQYLEAGLDLSSILANRRWRLNNTPWPHFFVESVFERGFFGELEQQFNQVLGRGLGEPSDPTRFSRNMPNSDAFGWNLLPDLDGPLAFFWSRPWHDMLVGLTGASSTRDVNAALHHHPVGSADGSVHRDVGVGWFSDQHRADGVNPMDLARCSYTSGAVKEEAGAAREVVRSLTMIFYLCNPDWRQGDGGETGLYRFASDAVSQPALRIPPLNNSILIFENRLDTYHSFLTNRRGARNSIILWLHRRKEEAVQRWGDHNIYRWKAR